MSQRKLQQDIDKLLKKVKEGVEDFDDIYEKFQSTDPSNSSHREKLESDLKREIKKLQKHRDQIKTWLSKEDVKDKQNVLMTNRRLIENGMERFKSVEKLMKTKQFSKEALTNPDIIKDPKELKKRDQVVFIHECLDELQKQLEQFEAHENEEQTERHEFHIANLENILKKLQNNEMEPEPVQEFQDDIKYYVENNDDPDFIEYDTIYEDMGCEIQPSLVNNSEAPKEAPKEANNQSSVSSIRSTKKQERSPKKKVPLKQTSTLDTVENSSAQAAESVSQSASPSPTPVSIDTPLNTVKDDTMKLDDSFHSPPATNVSMKKKESENDSEEQLSFPQDRTEEIQKIIQNDIETNPAFQNPLFSDELKYWLDSKKYLMQPLQEMSPKMVSQLESSLLNCPDSLDADSPCLYTKPLSLPHPTSIFFPSEPIRFVYPYDVPLNLTNSENDTTDKFDKDGKIKSKKHDDIYSRTSLARIFMKFDLDTLFFIFYHYQGSYEQFLAARELYKNRNWLFNRVDRCWYYKEIEKLPPGMGKSEEESWRYFDYKKSWLARRCGNDFVYNEDDFEKL
ncbi:proteinral negative regulator of transcription subunit 5 [Saccharomyces pastorianus]|uniref:General negative regulator of transcription subunit n=1 Tax=Saccharomyces pastorianus TaxID=27292 RepID=A0A6C1EHL6_SACPS|nr:NOT5-like protein [Saccharomyces eubayanus]KOG96369.1 NOT5-like protein [Saccharomyces eubayanus]QID88489.1 proteinral negative regulator of transcription subunit 5 [Saccharomyces pastorianus]